MITSMAHSWLPNICQFKVFLKELIICKVIFKTHKKIVFQLEVLIREKANVAQRMMLMAEISSVSSAIRRILAIPPYTLI